MLFGKKPSEGNRQGSFEEAHRGVLSGSFVNNNHWGQGGSKLITHSIGQNQYMAKFKDQIRRRE